MVLKNLALLHIEMNVHDPFLPLPEYHTDNVPIYYLRQYIKAIYRQEIKVVEVYTIKTQTTTDFLLEHPWTSKTFTVLIRDPSL